MTGPTRVLLVDDDALVRAGLSMMLNGADGIAVVGEAADGDQVATAADAHSPDVVLMDLRMPRVDGITATRRLRARPRPPEVIVLTTFDADENVLRALRAGASGFLLKDSPPGQIAEAIRRVAAGDPILSPKITRRLMDRAAAEAGAHERARAWLRGLSPREHEVVVAIARGRTNAEIAAELYMSVPTVKAHITHILTKLRLGTGPRSPCSPATPTSPEQRQPWPTAGDVGPAYLWHAGPMAAHPLPGVLANLAPVLDHYGYLAVGAFITLEDFGVPVPGETVLIAAAVYAGAGRLNIVAVGIIAVLAAVAGDNIGYAIGYFGGRALVLRYGKYVMLTSERLDKAEDFFRRYGGAVVAGARFFEGLRQVNGIVAGTIRMAWPRFVAFNALGAALWVGAWASVGYLAGDHIAAIYSTVSRYSLYLVIALAAALAALIIRAVARRRRHARR
jgi:DNA-binding NarL/FixJ family response regulator/membrane protein DedA with SNARE-associated domain